MMLRAALPAMVLFVLGGCMTSRLTVEQQAVAAHVEAVKATEGDWIHEPEIRRINGEVHQSLSAALAPGSNTLLVQVSLIPKRVGMGASIDARNLTTTSARGQISFAATERTRYELHGRLEDGGAVLWVTEKRTGELAEAQSSQRRLATADLQAIGGPPAP